MRQNYFDVFIQILQQSFARKAAPDQGGMMGKDTAGLQTSLLLWGQTGAVYSECEKLMGWNIKC